MIPKQDKYNVEFVTALDPQGEEFYSYLLIPELLLEKFRKQLKRGEVKLEEYGVVLASGKGHVPSAEHTNYINQRFGDKN